MIARIAEGMDTVASPAGRDLPAPVFVASLFGFAKAAFLGFMGIIGILTWDDVTEPWGYGSLALAILFGPAPATVATVMNGTGRMSPALRRFTASRTTNGLARPMRIAISVAIHAWMK